jgi:hypothetical protein
MNKAKADAKIDGKTFLRNAFSAEQKVLACHLELSTSSITHDGVMGDVNEQHFIHFLRRHLPKRYEVDTAIVIDSNGATSDQIDIVIFDHQYTPTLLDQQNHRFIPAEAVYGVLEVKPTINKKYVDYAGDKAESVRILERTSVPIQHVGGEYPPKKLFPIVAGIVATGVEWVDGIASQSFADSLSGLAGNRSLDCGVALSDRSFDTFDGRLNLSTPDGSLVYFLFRLLQRLQSLGTVPAIDWNRYAAVFGDARS